MIITCPHCHNQHDVDETQIPARASMARCRHCSRKFPLTAGGAEENGQETELPATAQAHGASKQRRCRKLGVINCKGGVGKTTTAVNLAMGLAMGGFEVLLVDADIQGQCAYSLGLEPARGLTELILEESTPEEAMIRARERLSFLAGGKGLAGIKRMIDRRDLGSEQVLATALAGLQEEFDYMIVDGSPGWDQLTANILFLVTEVLAPVSLSPMALYSLTEFVKSLSSIQQFQPTVTLKYILPNFYDRDEEVGADLLETLYDKYGKSVCSPIHHDMRLCQAPEDGKTIYEFAPGSQGAVDFRGLVRNVANNDKLLR